MTTNLHPRHAVFLFIGLFSFMSPVHCQSKAEYACTSVSAGKTTVWGHEHLVVTRENKKTKLAEGSVRALDDSPISGVLVEVFTRQKSDPPVDQTNTNKRMTACETGPNGTFRFDLPSGYYEIRASDSGFNSTSVLIHVDTRSWLKHPIKVPMRVGD